MREEDPATIWQLARARDARTCHSRAPLFLLNYRHPLLPSPLSVFVVSRPLSAIYRGLITRILITRNICENFDRSAYKSPGHLQNDIHLQTRIHLQNVTEVSEAEKLVYGKWNAQWQSSFNYIFLHVLRSRFRNSWQDFPRELK